MPAPRPISLVAERAVRLLRDGRTPLTSVKLAAELLSTRIADESRAQRVLEAAFAGDPRLFYREGGWMLSESRPSPSAAGATDPRSAPSPATDDPDLVMMALQGGRTGRLRPWILTGVAAVRLSGDDVAAACGGETLQKRAAERLRKVVLETLEGAVPVVHDPPGSLVALQRWLDEPYEAPLSLRELARARLGLPARHTLHDLAGHLGIEWQDTDDPLQIADTLHACLSGLRRPGESIQDLRLASGDVVKAIEWSRYAFDRAFLRQIPREAGTYRFYDRDGRLLYVGRSNNLHRRVGSYFRQGVTRPARVQRLLDEMHRIEFESSGSGLEAMLREAEQIRSRSPKANVQRSVHSRTVRDDKLRSILILEPAARPLVLRAYLLRDGRLLGRIGIGPRGGGLKRIERLLEDHFFCMPTGPTPAGGPDVDVEVVARWLSGNRDRAVAFDPTDLRSAREVTDRLRWFLARGGPFDPDGLPIVGS